MLSEAIKTNSLIDLHLAIDFSKNMRGLKVNHIHCHSGDHKLYIGYYCKCILEISLSVTIHAYELYSNPNWSLFKKSLLACDSIISISNYNKEFLIKNFGIPPDKIKVVYLFVPNKIIKPKFKVLIVGRFALKKGHEVLFRAIKQLNRDDVELWVAGSGPVNLRQKAKEFGIEDKVVFFGNVSDAVLRVLYENCNLFCLPSRKATWYNAGKIIEDNEGIPVSLMEAMSFGKPVISTKHAGIPELVENILVEENNCDELAKALGELIDNLVLSEKMGIRNREIIDNNFSEKNALKLLEIFESLTSISFKKHEK